MSKTTDAMRECFPLEGPDDILEFLALEAVDRLLEPAYAEARTELENRLKALVSRQGWKLYVVLDDLVGEFWLDTVGLLSKLVPALVRILEARTPKRSESFEEVFQAAISEAGVSPKKPDEIQALEGLGAFGVSSLSLRRRAAAKLELEAAESL